MTGTVLEPRRPWKGRRVVLGVTGGIAAYKSVQLARNLTRLGAEVDVVLTRSAQEFATPLSFEGVTGRDVFTSLWSVEGAARHIRLGGEADAVVVAPATADFLARAAQGRSDDLLTTTLLATRAPVVVCPAMNDRMWAHPAVQANAARLAELGYQQAGPAAGPLAAGESDGAGRMLEPWQIVEWVGRALGSDPAFRGRTVLITAGPTREALDPVRFLGNRSTGRMGYALAQAAWRRGARVRLVSGPSSLAAPEGVERIQVETAREMLEAVRSQLEEAHVSIFAAAVADYRPREARDRKMKRGGDDAEPTLELTANPDVAADTRGRRAEGSITVGFALETEDLLEHARAKLEAKGFDLLVANPAGEADAGFESETNRVTLLSREGEAEELPLQSKDAVAEAVLDRVAELLPGASDAAGAAQS